MRNSSSNPNLHLYEEYLLLALRDDKGTPDYGVSLEFGLGGALLADLLMLDCVEVEQDGKRTFLKLKAAAMAGDPLLDECITKVKQSKRRATLQTWVQRFGAIRKLKHRAAQQLCERGILKLEEGTVLLLFKRKVYPELDGRAEKEILSRLKRAIFTSTRELEARTMVLIALANSTGLLRANFDKKKLKEKKKRIAEITQGELTGQVTGEAAAQAVQAAVTAVIAAATIPIMVASAGS